MTDKGSPLQVAVGTHVEVQLVDQSGNCEILSFDIVRAQAADFDRGLMSSSTPMAKAIMDKSAGSVIPYSVGELREVRIVSVEPSRVRPAADAQQRREAVLKKARDAAARTNAEMFASSFSGKWGDYDIGDSSE